jgi:hypothetical protein
MRASRRKWWLSARAGAAAAIALRMTTAAHPLLSIHLLSNSRQATLPVKLQITPTTMKVRLSLSINLINMKVIESD